MCWEVIFKVAAEAAEATVVAATSVEVVVEVVVVVVEAGEELHEQVSHVDAGRAVGEEGFTQAVAAMI